MSQLVYTGPMQDLLIGETYIEDMVELISKSQIGIYTLRSGTGMQNKILEAIACGLPSVATSIAVNGLPYISKDEIIIADTKEEIIKAIIYLK